MNYLKTTLLGSMLALVFLPLTAPTSALAGQSIEFTHEGMAEGFRLNGQIFSDGPYEFIITGFGDTGDREEIPSGNGWYIDHTAAMIEIVGVGTFGILTPTRTFVNNNAQAVGFSRGGQGGTDLFTGPMNPTFADWDMTTSIGPIFGNDGRLLQWLNEPPIETTGGTLAFFDEEDIPVIFTAEVIPAPGPIALLAPAAGAFCILRRRRRC